MDACVSVMRRLETLSLGFHSPRSRPDRFSRRPPPMTCGDLLILTHPWYQKPSEYLDDFVARVNDPQLHIINSICLSSTFHIFLGSLVAWKDSRHSTIHMWSFRVNLVQRRISLQNENVVHSNLALGYIVRELACILAPYARHDSPKQTHQLPRG